MQIFCISALLMFCSFGKQGRLEVGRLHSGVFSCFLAPNWSKRYLPCYWCHQRTCLSCGQLLTGATRPGSKAPFRQEMCKIFEVHCQKKTSFVLCRHISLDLFILPFHLALRPLTNNRPSFISMINYQNRLKKCCRQEIRNFQSLLDFNASCHTPG